MGNNCCPAPSDFAQNEVPARIAGGAKPQRTSAWGDGGLHVFADSLETLSDAEHSPNGSFSSNESDPRQLYEDILGIRSPSHTTSAKEGETVRSQFSRLLRRNRIKTN